MRPEWISDQPFHDLLPYVRMLGDQTMLLCNPPGLSPRGISRGFALGAMWRIGQLNCDALAWGAIHDALSALLPPLRDLPPLAIFEVRMTLRPTQSDPAWVAARQGLEHPTIEAQMEHIESGMVHHIEGRKCRAMQVEAHVGVRIPIALDIPKVRGHFETVLAEVEAHHQSLLDEFHDYCGLLEMQLDRGAFEPSRLDLEAFATLIARSLHPETEKAPLMDPHMTLGANVVQQSPTLSPEGYATAGWEASVYSLRKPPAWSFPGILSAARLPRDRSVGVNLWELATETPLTLVTQLALANQSEVKRHVSLQRWMAGFFKRGISGQEVTAVTAVTDSLETFAQALATGDDLAVRLGTHLIVWNREPSRSIGPKAVQYAMQRAGMEFLPETLEGNLMFMRTLPLAGNLQCPDEKLLRRMRTFPLSTAVHLMPLLGSFRGYGAHTPGVRVLNGRGEPVHFNPLIDNHRPHGVIVGSNRSGKSALANWMANCLVPQGITFIFMDRHGSYEALCRLHGGTHISLSREQPVCLGPFDGDLGPDHQDLLLTLMAEMSTRLSRVTPQASSTLSNREALVLAQQLKRWAERGDLNSVPTLGQFVAYLGASTVETEICSTLVTLLSPYCGEGPFAAFIDGPAEVQLSQGLWSFDIAPLVNAGQLGAVVTTVLLGWVDRFIKAPEHLEVGKFLVMDEVSFDLKTPQAVELIDRHIRAYARFNAGMWLISQNMSDFRGEIGEIIRNNCGQFIAFALNPDEAQRFTDTFTPEAPHVVDMIKKLKPHRDCSQGFIYLPDGGSGVIRVVADPEFMMQIGQSRWHREQRHQRLEDLRS